MLRDLDSPTVVIAHGAWIGATSWREVIALLQLKGVRVIAVQSPLTALADDVDAVIRAVNQQRRSVVLVGHGYGGTVITQAGNHPRVVALVYVSAFAPDIGESTTNAREDYPPPACIGRLAVDAGGFLSLAPEAVVEFLAHDLPAMEGSVIAAAQKPIRAGALLDRVTEAAWHTRRSWYAVTENDRMLSPIVQREIANRIGAETLVLHASHVPFLSKPMETAGVIFTAVDSMRSTHENGQ